MGTTAEKLNRLKETKALLKQRLADKGIDVSQETSFYRLADKVGEIAGGAEWVPLPTTPTSQPFALSFSYYSFSLAFEKGLPDGIVISANGSPGSGYVKYCLCMLFHGEYEPAKTNQGEFNLINETVQGNIFSGVLQANDTVRPPFYYKIFG